MGEGETVTGYGVWGGRYLPLLAPAYRQRASLLSPLFSLLCVPLWLCGSQVSSPVQLRSGGGFEFGQGLLAEDGADHVVGGSRYDFLERPVVRAVGVVVQIGANISVRHFEIDHLRRGIPLLPSGTQICCLLLVIVPSFPARRMFSCA
jgi:hypothetical protein